MADDEHTDYEHAKEVEALRARVAELERERDEARVRLRAFIGSVEEMTLGEGVPAGLVVSDDGGKTIRVVQSRVTREWYEAIMDKWHKDEAVLVALYNGYMLRATRAESAEAELARLREYASKLRQELAEEHIEVTFEGGTICCLCGLVSDAGEMTRHKPTCLLSVDALRAAETRTAPKGGPQWT